MTLTAPAGKPTGVEGDEQMMLAMYSSTPNLRITIEDISSPEWGPFEGLGPDILEGIRRIKSQDGPDLILSGSSTLTSTLLEHGLADGRHGG